MHVEYEWCLHNEDLDESDDEMEDKVLFSFTQFLCHTSIINFLDTVELYNLIYSLQ